MTGQHFISNDLPNVAGLVMAGSAGFKTELSETEMLDKRLMPVICAVLDVSYGGENGLSEAITLAADSLTNVKFVAEKKLVSKFFEEIAQDTGMVVFGVEDTMKAMEVGALETMMLFEDLDVNRYELKNPVKGDIKVVILNSIQEKNPKFFKDHESG